MSMYKDFKTDTGKEQDGIWIKYDTFQVRIARSGGSNKKYAKLLEVKARPFRRAIETETMSAERGNELVRDVFAEACVLDWETLQTTDKGDVWVKGIEAQDGTILPFSVANVLDTFKALPELYKDLQEMSNKVSLWRAADVEAASGN